MMISRVVAITRATPLELLIQRFGTFGQAKFHLQSRGESIEWYESLHARLEAGLKTALSHLPPKLPYTRLSREHLDRFLFAPDDAVMVVGQDGLMANVAKYLQGQIAFGVNPDVSQYEGVLCPHAPDQSGHILQWCANLTQFSAVPLSRDSPANAAGIDGLKIEARVLAYAQREDGQRLLALNEVFVGHRSHQSARYRLHVTDDKRHAQDERQSSSGLIVATGTGSTGWAKSITTQRGITESMPGPEEQRLAWFVREPWESVASNTQLNFGWVKTTPLRVISEMGEGGVVFADGIEGDFIEFASGQSVEIGVAEQRLNLVVRGR